MYAGVDKRADEEANHIFEQVATFLSDEPLGIGHAIATGFAERVQSLQNVRAYYHQTLELRDRVRIYLASVRSDD